MANRSRRDVGCFRSEPNASLSARASTVCGRGPVVTSITSTTGRLSFYQTAGHSTGLRNVAHRGVTTTRLATHNSRMRGSRLRADVLRVIPTGEIVARQLDVPDAGQRRHLMIALWLGHLASGPPTPTSTPTSVSTKEKALALTRPASALPGRYRPPDKVLAFLESL
jgi:hypothetical protein